MSCLFPCSLLPLLFPFVSLVLLLLLPFPFFCFSVPLISPLACRLFCLSLFLSILSFCRFCSFRFTPLVSFPFPLLSLVCESKPTYFLSHSLLFPFPLVPFPSRTLSFDSFPLCSAFSLLSP